MADSRFTGDIACPYCGRAVERRMVFSAEDTRDFGEHCDNCALPFDIDPRDGSAISQDDPRWNTDLPFADDQTGT